MYVVVDQPGFKMENKKTGVMEAGWRHTDVNPTSRPVYSISIAHIFENVNTKDILRYAPDDMLNDMQRKIKWEGIAETIKYTNDKNDKKYNEFIKEGNLIAARDMVIAAAKANGYTVEAWHGTKNSFNVFSKEKLGSSTHTKASEKWFFAADKETAESYHPYSVMKKLEDQGYWKAGTADSLRNKGNLYHLFLKMENPLEVDVSGYDYASHRENADAMVEYLEKAERDGNDGIILYHVRDNNLNPSAEESTDYLFKEPSQAKSADVIAYDDNGNVIPLSERFDEKNDDIRYSISDEKDSIEESNARIREDNEFLRHQIGRTEKTKWKKALTPAAVDRLTAQLRKTWGIAKSEENRIRPMFGIADEYQKTIDEN